MKTQNKILANAVNGLNSIIKPGQQISRHLIQGGTNVYIVTLLHKKLRKIVTELNFENPYLLQCR